MKRRSGLFIACGFVLTRIASSKVHRDSKFLSGRWTSVVVIDGLQSLVIDGVRVSPKIEDYARYVRVCKQIFQWSGREGIFLQGSQTICSILLHFFGFTGILFDCGLLDVAVNLFVSKLLEKATSSIQLVLSATGVECSVGKALV